MGVCEVEYYSKYLIERFFSLNKNKKFNFFEKTTETNEQKVD